MNPYAVAAGVVSAAMGLVHAVLGERLLLAPLLRRDDLPPLLGSAAFAKRTLRFSWHVATVLLWAFGAVLFVLAGGTAGAATAPLLRVAAAGFLACALVAGGVTRGRHFAWAGFLAMAALAWLGAR